LLFWLDASFIDIKNKVIPLALQPNLPKLTGYVSKIGDIFPPLKGVRGMI